MAGCDNTSHEPCGCTGFDVQALMCEILDPGISPQRATEIRAIIERCPECVSRMTNEREIRLLMQRCCHSETAPGYLKKRITTQIRIISQG